MMMTKETHEAFMEQQNKTIMFGLKLERDRLNEEIKKMERRYNRATSLDKEIEIDCKKQDLITKLEEIMDSINKRRLKPSKENQNE